MARRRQAAGRRLATFAGGNDVAIELELWPDSGALAASCRRGEPQPMLGASDPIIRFTVWEGKLTDLATNRLDTSFMRRSGSGLVGADRDRRRALPGGLDMTLAISFPNCGSTRCSR